MMMLRELSDRASLTREVREYAVDDVEVRAADDGGVAFEGTASVVDAPYVVRDMFGEFSETIATGAFNRTIKQKGDVRLLVNHEGVPLARTKSNTLSLAADPHLRAFAPSLDPKNPDVQRIQSAMTRGDMDQMSIGMRVRDQEWSDDYSERTIREIELFDVSIVTYPASPTTTAALRSVDELLVELADVELDEDELRRAIAALEARLPEPIPVARTRPELLALWAKRPL
jgi:HK97 family phage prohead protease